MRLLHYKSTELDADSEYEPSIEPPQNVGLEGKIDHIRLTKPSYLKLIFFVVLSILSAGLLPMLCFWLPKLHIFFTLSKAPIQDASRVVIYGEDGTIQITPLKKEGKESHKTFEFRLFKYVFQPLAGKFIPVQFSVSGLSYSKIHEKYGQGIEDDCALQGQIYYGPNLTDIPSKSCLRLFIEEILSPFYVFQIFSIVVWSFDDYIPYASLIALITLGSILETLWETRIQINKLRKLAYYECQITVFRNGALDKPLTISSAELVPGDIFVVPDNAAIPCDAILLNGSCIMNESMLTGESVPVLKNSLPYGEITYSAQEDKQYTLYAGTQCIQTRFYKGNVVLALVTDTGFATVKGDLIRSMLFPKPSNFKFYVDSFKFLGFLAFVALVGFAIDLLSLLSSGDIIQILIKGAEIITVTVPPALPACMAVGISYGLGRLKQHGMFCISPNKINEAGKITIMCFDKTGTLTEDGLDILGVKTVFIDKNTEKLGFRKMQKKIKAFRNYPYNKAEDLPLYANHYKTGEKKSIFEATKMLPEEYMFEIMSTCHSLTAIDGKLVGDPLDVKMFEATSNVIEENPSEKFDNIVLAIVKPDEKMGVEKQKTNDADGLDVSDNELGIIRRFDFSSKLQRMSVIVKRLDENGFRLHAKGSPEKIRELCRPETVPENFHETLEKYAENGYRVLALATKVLNVGYKKIATATRDDFETDLTFIGLLVMENRLKPVTTSVINQLHNAKIKTVMVTGDNVLTAISVARQCQIVLPHQRVFLGDVSEKKTGGQEYIVWKDFNRSDVQINLENDNEDGSRIDLTEYDVIPEEDNEESSGLYSASDSISLKSENCENKSLRSVASYSRQNTGRSQFVRTMSRKKSAQSIFEESEDPKAKNSTLLDLEPPFFDLEPQEYTLAVTGKAFAFILREAEENHNAKYAKIMKRMLKQCAIYARMLPDQKAMMINQLQQFGKSIIVGMCGDGANDCGALKAADVGVSLSEAEASIAAPFTSKIQDINCIVNLLRYGRAALVTSFQTFKYVALYSVIQFTSVTILYYLLADLTNASYYYIDIFLIVPLSAAMAMQEAYPSLSKYQPSDRLISWPILTSFVGQAAIQIFFQVVVTYLLVTNPNFYIHKCQSSVESSAGSCDLNTALFLFSNFQYTTVAFAFNVGEPFRQPFYSNRWFTGFLLIATALNIYICTVPFDWVVDLLSMVRLEWEFIQYLFLPLVLINTALTLIWEAYFVKLITDKVYKMRQRARNEEMQKLKEQNPGVSIDISSDKCSVSIA